MILASVELYKYSIKLWQSCRASAAGRSRNFAHQKAIRQKKALIADKLVARCNQSFSRYGLSRHRLGVRSGLWQILSADTRKLEDSQDGWALSSVRVSMVLIASSPRVLFSILPRRSNKNECDIGSFFHLKIYLKKILSPACLAYQLSWEGVH